MLRVMRQPAKEKLWRVLRYILRWLAAFTVYLGARALLDQVHAPLWATWIVAGALAALTMWALERWNLPRASRT